ncbi:hypothetical protein D3C75_1225700 [compost metagenome]
MGKQTGKWLVHRRGVGIEAMVLQDANVIERWSLLTQQKMGMVKQVLLFACPFGFRDSPDSGPAFHLPLLLFRFAVIAVTRELFQHCRLH